MSDDQARPSATERSAARAATNWAKSISRLNVSEVPDGAVNINVTGRRLTSPIQGFGKMWQKTYQGAPSGRAGLGDRSDRHLEAALPGLLAGRQPLLRPAHRDPIFELGLTLGGHRQEDHFWQHTLTQLALHFDHEAEVDTQVVCVDKRRQWSRWRNVWQSSAIRSTIYTLGTPGRALKRLLKRDRPAT